MAMAETVTVKRLKATVRAFLKAEAAYVAALKEAGNPVMSPEEIVEGFRGIRDTAERKRALLTKALRAPVAADAPAPAVPA